MKNVIEVRGKAKNVFRYVELMKQQKGNVTIGELAKNVKSIKIDLR